MQEVNHENNIATKPFIRFAVYILFAFFSFFLNYFTNRENFVQLFSFVTILFAIYFTIIIYWKNDSILKEAIFVAILIRISLIFTAPHLSDDFYRFIWDGQTSLEGYNPYSLTPNEIIKDVTFISENENLIQEIFIHLNSKDYHSVYPPTCQGIFYLASLIANSHFQTNIWLLKAVIVLFEIGTLFFILKIISLLNFKKTNALIYAFNPLVIIELSGNIHFEAAMIFFLSVAIYFLLKEKLLYSALLFGLAVSIKLWPLMFLPLLIQRIGWTKTIRFTIIVILFNLCLFIPFLNQSALHNYQTSLELYFSTFSFNASFYYLIRWIFDFNQSNLILLQKLLPILLLLFILLYSITFSQHSFIQKMMFVFTLFLLLSTTIHPWYLSCLLLFSSISRLRYPLIWSFLICLTYATYISPNYTENFLFIQIEYIVVFIFIWYENKFKIFKPI